MAKRIVACRRDELAPGSVMQVSVDGRKPLAIYNVNGEFYATDDTCTHGEASLADGELEGQEIICPFHMGGFDVRTGEASIPPCSEPLRTYPVIVDDDTLLIEVDE